MLYVLTGFGMFDLYQVFENGAFVPSAHFEISGLKDDWGDFQPKYFFLF